MLAPCIHQVLQQELLAAFAWNTSTVDVHSKFKSEDYGATVLVYLLSFVLLPCSQVLVSEDSCISDIRGGVACGHVNSALWTLNSKANLRFADMNRILTAPSLSSISSKWYPDMSQKSYITSTVNRIGSSEKSARDGGDLTATFGYTGPFLNEVSRMLPQESTAVH